MNLIRIISLLIFMLSSLNLQSMESHDIHSSHDNSVKELGNEDSYMPQPFPLEMKIKIFEDMINSARTLPECDNLFKALILINKDLSSKENNYNIRYFRSVLFTKLALKKYTILCEIERHYRNERYPGATITFDIINNGVNRHFGDDLAPLHCVRTGPVTQVLIENGANINAQDFVQWTPLHYAVLCKEEDVIEELVNHGADITLSTPLNGTSLDLAIHRKHHHIETFFRKRLQEPQNKDIHLEIPRQSVGIEDYKTHIILAVCTGIIICTCWILKKRIQTLLSKEKQQSTQGKTIKT